MTGWESSALAAGIPATGAVVAAVVAARSAIRSKAAEIQATRILDPERRRAEIFETFIAALEQLWKLVGSGKTSSKAFEKGPLVGIRQFMHWVQIYGSDDAVVASQHFMQAIFHDAPPSVLVRLTGDLIIVARRELGFPKTSIGAVEVLGTFLNDVYDDPQSYADLTDPIDQVFARHNWTPPWR